ncbi:MAG TPA: Holliday junction resolvase RuvX [Tepidisphaeraceae bacterium]|jgi:putative Holliday junction resolvase|nr:Holliday junction resolvase RuvX [Tepidisphaeraceae bacterium]
MRTLAIDLGSRRVGLALSDEGGKFSSPYDVLTVATPEQARSQVLAVIRKEEAQRLVVGLPLNMDDSIGPAARDTITWAAALGREAGLAPIFIDERLSSFAAEQSLIDRKRGGEKITRSQRKQRLDALAAAAFLQEFLDGKLQPIQVND